MAAVAARLANLTPTVSSSNRLLTVVRWLAPTAAVLVPVACSPALAESFEGPKLAIMKVGLAVALSVLALRGRLDTGILRVPAALVALVLLGFFALATITSLDRQPLAVSPRRRACRH